MATKAKTDYRPREKELPSILTDPKTNKRYARGRFLGKGGFAKCYELTDTETNEVYAGKIVSKGLLLKQHQKEKMSQEITIHKSLNHKHIVGFLGFFEDSDNVYIILELCRRRSLMELHKRRKTVSEPEARYFLRHIVLACKYLHDTKVIHRDLKLGNLFLNETMEVKIGDFGLATKLDYDGERKKTLCGTPNYIAPEVLGKRGHSYEVDAWSLGCILFTLLVGKPPFETSSLKDTYNRIKKNEYIIPSSVSAAPRNLIRRLLNADPAKRPNMDTILHDEFLTKGFLPTRLPTSCCSMAPRFDNKVDPSFVRKPLLELNAKPVAKSCMSVAPVKKVSANQQLDAVPEGAVLKARNEKKDEELPEDLRINNEDSSEQHLTELLKQLNAVFDKKVTERPLYQEDEAEDPAANPVFWISKWVDYSDKYGLGYQLCDNSVGVVFNDSTKIVLLADGENIHYIDRNGRENYHTLNNHPDSLNKKMTLLKYFRNYMNEHLLKAGAAMTPRDGDELSRIPNLKTWLRTRNAIILQLTNGTMQINFFSDHTKLILCPLMGAVTFFDDRQNIRTFRLSLIAKYGCSSELSARLRFARCLIRDRLLIAEADKGKAET